MINIFEPTQTEAILSIGIATIIFAIWIFLILKTSHKSRKVSK